MRKPITDKLLLAQLENGAAIDQSAKFSPEEMQTIMEDSGGDIRQPVTDALVLAQLEGKQLSQPKSTQKADSPSETWQSVGTRLATNAVAALPEFLIDTPLWATGRLGNSINGLLGYPQNLPEPTPVKDAKNKYLSMFGVNPNASGAAEKVAQAGINALTSAGLSSGTALPSILSSVPSRQVAGAVAGQSAAETAKAAGAGETAQALANVAGGVLGTNVAGIVEGGAKGIGNAGKVLLTDDGKDLVASRALYRQTTNPDLTIDALENPNLRIEYLKGSKPITAEIAQDPGISMLGKSLGNNQVAVSLGLDQIHNQRLGDIASIASRQMDKANRVNQSGEDILNKLRRIKQLSVQKFEDGKDLSGTPVDTSNINRVIANQMDNFQGNTSVENYLNKIGNSTSPDPSSLSNFRRVWNNRKAIDEELYNTTSDPKVHAGVKDSMTVAAGNIRQPFNAALVDAYPDFQDFLRRYAFASDYENKLKTGRNIADKIKTSATTARQNANDVTGDRGISQFQATKIGDMLTDIAGNDSELAKRLTDRQLRLFKNIANEQERAKALTSLGASVGSPTASYIGRGGLLGNDIIDGIIGQQQGQKSGLVRMIGHGLGNAIGKTGLFDPAEEEIMRRVGAGMIDPDIALAMLKRGKENVKGPLDFGKTIKNNSEAGLIQSLLNR